MKKERLDKIISNQLKYSRTDASKLIRGGNVSVNGVIVKDPATKVDGENDTIVTPNGEIVYEKYIYIMMNKPQGVVSASRSPNEKTVIDLLDESLKRKGLFPAGRLDKDTTGFMLITDDGDFAHNILSPKHHVEKEYLATTDNKISEDFLNEIRLGMTCGEDEFLPSEIELLEDGENPVYRIILHEGKYHQIKRMITKSGVTLLSLKRIRMGDLDLDSSLAPGEARKMTKKEIKLIKH